MASTNTPWHQHSGLMVILGLLIGAGLVFYASSLSNGKAGAAAPVRGWGLVSVPVPNDGTDCPKVFEVNMMAAVREVGPISISGSANTCAGKVIAGSFREVEIMMAHRRAGSPGLVQGDAFVEGGLPLHLALLGEAGHLNSVYGVIDCCTTRSGNTLSMGANCNGSDPTLQRFCVYKAGSL